MMKRVLFRAMDALYAFGRYDRRKRNLVKNVLGWAPAAPALAVYLTRSVEGWVWQTLATFVAGLWVAAATGGFIGLSDSWQESDADHERNAVANRVLAWVAEFMDSPSVALHAQDGLYDWPYAEQLVRRFADEAESRSIDGVSVTARLSSESLLDDYTRIKRCEQGGAFDYPRSRR